MSTWEDENDGDLEEFDPAKSAIDTKNYFNNLDVVYRDEFIELFIKQFPQYKDIDKKKFYDTHVSVAVFFVVEDYVQPLIRHYYYSTLPYEDDLEPVGLNAFPSDKEIKRFLKARWGSTDFDLIDKYTGSQPNLDDKEKSLELMLPYFEILKRMVHKYYPQMEHLPSRGFRELERSLYTITYLSWMDLYEAKERVLGINKDYYDKIDKELKQKKEGREKRKAAREKKNTGKKWNDLTDEEKEAHKKEWEEMEQMEEIEYEFLERLYVKMANRFLELYPELDLPYDDFLAKTKSKCNGSYQSIFFIVCRMLKHFKESDGPYKNDAFQFTSSDYEYYLRLKNEGEEVAEAYLNQLDDWDKEWLIFDINWHEMGKAMLSEFYNTFPFMVDLSSAAMLEIKNQVFGAARYNLKEFFGVRNRVLKVESKAMKKWDDKIEQIERKHFEGED